MDCIFCKVVSKEFEAAKVYEDDDVLAFLDINPLTKGHCLVVPKIHFEDVFDIEADTLQKVIVVGKQVAKKIKMSLAADGIRLSQSNGKAAGQAVFHFHLHIIPRYLGDGLQNGMTETRHSKPADFEELKKLV